MRHAFTALLALGLGACTADSGAAPRSNGPASAPARAAAAAGTIPGAAVAAEAPTTPKGRADRDRPLGVKDVGVFADLDQQVRLRLPYDIDPARLSATLDPTRDLLLLYDGGRPLKVYPTGGEAVLRLGADGEREVGLRPDDAAELRPLLAGRPLRVLAAAEVAPPADLDRDGIPDTLDLVIGAKKVALNGASYGGEYVTMSYPNGDLPRDQGKCADVLVRAARNAGLDIQKALYEDIGRAPRAYPFVKRRDPSIDQRRVKTILPYFKRHWEAHTVDYDDAADPYLPGDIVFFDTFPDREGPDHVGIVSDGYGRSGRLLVVNNWDDGYQEQEMDLLHAVPVTHRFRMILH
jgi:uncharacterized protein YijF (DUF1287 family)